MTSAAHPANTPASPATRHLVRAWRRLPWPLPAVLSWLLAWLCWQVGRSLLVARAGSGGEVLALGLGCTVGLILAFCCAGKWRRLLAGAGFPLIAVASGNAAGVLPVVFSGGSAAWWLLPLAVLFALYPVRAWRDAPLFPTPARALAGLQAIVGPVHRVLDAGSGLGHGLRALRRLWPQAELHGVEWSPLLAWATSLHLRLDGTPAKVRQGDMWAESWGPYEVVYLFQRPESMPRAWEKAQEEMAPGAWLVSLEFAVPEVTPSASLQAEGQKPVWIYRVLPAISDSNRAPVGR